MRQRQRAAVRKLSQQIIAKRKLGDPSHDSDMDELRKIYRKASDETYKAVLKRVQSGRRVRPELWQMVNRLEKLRLTTHHCGLDPLLVAQAYAAVYKRKQSAYGPEDAQLLPVGEQLSPLDDDFTAAELERALRRLPNNKAPGLDNLPHEAYKALGPRAKGHLLQACNSQLCGGDIQFGRSRFVLIPKGSDTSDPLKMRPLSIQQTARKILDELIKGRLHRLFKQRGSDGHDPAQAAYRSQRTAIDHLALVQAAISEATRTNRELFLVSFDLDSATE